jgi:tetratricopeptide (TPR) repeat protein
VSAAARAGREGARLLLVGALLAAAVVLLYLPAFHYPYISIDDRTLAEQNPLQPPPGAAEDAGRGLFSLHQGYWAPVTWLSFVVERRLFGEAPAVSHASNVLLHAANAALLLALLARLTGRLWPAALAAAIFAVHPAHVESVAWVAERKDVLSTLLGLGALLAYLGWVRRPRAGAAGTPWAALALFALSLAAKPMLVLLPLLLLLLDWWPLGRLRRGAVRAALAEKLPFAALSVVFAALTAAGQAGNLATVAAVPLATRFSYALVAPVRYLGTFLWPAGLAFAYPVRLHPYPAWLVALAPAAVAAALWWALRGRARRPWALAGLAWYLATLVPVSGIAQAGLTVVMDRVVYVPGIGLGLALAGGLGALSGGGARRGALAAVAAAGLAAVVALAAVSARQIAYWKDDCALFGRTVAVAPDSETGHWNLAVCLLERGDGGGALDHARTAAGLAPASGLAAFRLGTVYDSLGRYPEAVESFSRALALDPRVPGARAALGVALGALGRHEESVGHLREARRLDPGSAAVAYNLGVALLKLGRPAEAIPPLEDAVRLDPTDERAGHNLGVARRLAAGAVGGGAR